MNIQYQGEAGQTFYAIIRTHDMAFNPITNTMELIFTNIDHPTHAVSLAEHGYIGGYYTATVTASLLDGLYSVEYWQQTDASPDRSVDAWKGTLQVYIADGIEYESEAIANIARQGSSGAATGLSANASELSQIYRLVRELYNNRNK